MSLLSKYLFSFFAWSSLFLFGNFAMYVCWNAFINWWWDFMLCWVSTFPLCLYCPGVLLCLLFLWQVGPCSLMIRLILRSNGTWSDAWLSAALCHCVLVRLMHAYKSFMFFAHCYNGSTCLSYIYCEVPPGRPDYKASIAGQRLAIPRQRNISSPLPRKSLKHHESLTVGCWPLQRG
jgi:hypothetical protein